MRKLTLLLLGGLYGLSLQAQSDTSPFSMVVDKVGNQPELFSELVHIEDIEEEDASTLHWLSSSKHSYIKNLSHRLKDRFKAKKRKENLAKGNQFDLVSLFKNIHIEGPVAVHPTEDFVIFAGRKKGSLQLYQAKLKKGKWTKIQKLPFNKSNAQNGYPCFSANGDKLYFASDREGGYGQMDLYVVERYYDYWQTPYNLGEDINSAANEIHPDLHGKKLFFASDDKAGQGGFDLYWSKTVRRNTWGKRQNLGLAFNTAMDEIGMSIDENGMEGLLYSSRRSTAIKTFRWALDPQMDLALQAQHTSFQIQNDFLQATPKAKVTLIELAPGEIVAEQEPPLAMIGQANAALLHIQGNIKSLQTQEDGSFALTPRFKKDYLIIIESPDHAPYRQLFTYDDLITEKEIPIVLEKPAVVLVKTPQRSYFALATEELPKEEEAQLFLDAISLETENQTGTNLEVGRKIHVDNIYFPYNSTRPTQSSHAALDELVDILQENPSIEIKLVAHTDSKGSEFYNQQLSQQRASMTRQYLIQKGIAASRLNAIGMGESQPIYDCTAMECEENYHARNRRMEFIVSRVKGSESRITFYR